MTDYQKELEGTGKDIAGLRDGMGVRPCDPEKATRLAYRLYHRASLTAQFADFQAAEACIDAGIRQFGPQEDLCLLKVTLDFRFHRLDGVKRDLDMVPALRGRFEGRSILADLDFQEGRYPQARTALEDLIREDRSWDNLARLAYFTFKMGGTEEADRLYVEAEDELTAKEMRSYAWVELQRGVLRLSRGCYEDGLAHYRRAGTAYTGHWHTDEHIAEALAAQGRFDEAILLYRNVMERAPRPELQQTLGELYAFIGRTGEAQLWFEQALAGYLESAGRGDVHYYHHLTDFYADVREDGAEAVKWARMDLALRDNFATEAALAWALYRDRQFDAARDAMDRALSPGVRDARLFAQAAAIERAAGCVGDGARHLRMAEEINPRYRDFHVHR
ncbi:MAG: hypothetical protein ABSF54_16125 [Bryobacteraceae bacterium]|jgi:tetratricopeptide (TPR) repeat protein